MKQILSRKSPYHACTLDSQIIRKLIGKKTPAQRDEVAASDTVDVINDDMWKLMDSCWPFEPEVRPSCEEICQQLGLGGLSNVEFEDEAQAQYLQVIAGKNSDFKIDMAKVGEILSAVRHLAISTNSGLLTFGA